MKRVLNLLALVLFPINKPTRFAIGGYRISQIDVTFAGYTLVAGAVLTWYYSSWLWLPATVLSSILAWMMIEWLL